MNFNRKCILYTALIVTAVRADINRHQFNECPKVNLGELSHHSKHPKISKEQAALRIAGGVLFTAAVTYGARQIVGNGDGDSFYNGNYSWGLAQVLKFSGACFAIAPLLSEENSEAVYRWGKRAPITAALMMVVAHPSSQKLVSMLPYGTGDQISTYGTDPEGNFKSKCGSQCHGICDRCFLPKATLGVGIYKVGDGLIDKAEKYVSDKLGL